MTPGDFVIVGIVARRHLERSRAKGRVHVLVGDDGDLTPEDRHQRLLAHQRLVSFVLRVDGYCRIPQDRLRPRCGHFQIAALFERVAEGVELAFHLFVIHFQIADGAFAAWAPVHQVVAAVDQPLFVKTDEGFEHRIAQAVVQREAFARPIARDAHAPLLAADAPVVFVFPVPHFLHEAVATQFVTGDALFGQFTFHHILGGNAGMVGARHPQRGHAVHAVIACEQIFDAAGDGMAQMQRAGDVGRRHRNHEGLGFGIGQPTLFLLFGLEEARLFPPGVELLFPLLGRVRFGHFLNLCHRGFSSVFPKQKSRSSVKGRSDSWYHLFSAMA